MSESEERAFLHELNNKIAVIDGRMRLLLRKMKDDSDLSPDDVLSRIEQIQTTVTGLRELAAERCTALLSQDAA